MIEPLQFRHLRSTVDALSELKNLLDEFWSDKYALDQALCGPITPLCDDGLGFAHQQNWYNADDASLFTQALDALNSDEEDLFEASQFDFRV